MEIFRSFTKKLFDEDLLDELLMDDREAARAVDLEQQLKQTKIQLHKAQMELTDIRMSERSRIALVQDLAQSKQEYMELCHKQNEQLRCINEAEDEDEIKADCGVSAELKMRYEMVEMEKEQLLEENSRLRGEVEELQEGLAMMKVKPSCQEWGCQLPTYQDFALQINDEERLGDHLGSFDDFAAGYNQKEMKQTDEEENVEKLASMLKMLNQQLVEKDYVIY